MTPELINRRIAEWAGTLKTYPRKGACDCGSCARSNRCPDIIGPGGIDCKYEQKPDAYPDYYRTNAAMDLLPLLSRRGYKVDVQSDGPVQWSMVLQHPKMMRAICSLQSTIPAAIYHAILELIEREGR